jgi:quercetin dioxygenase-like cupin family protein
VSLSLGQLQQFVDRLAENPELWRHLIRHDPHARNYEQIWDDSDVNAWLICWSNEQDTGFHDHDDSAAAITVIEGEIRDERLSLGPGSLQRLLGPGETITVEPTAIHRVLHAGTTPAITIHAYSPPLTRTGSYGFGPGGALQRTPRSYAEELRAEPVLR